MPQVERRTGVRDRRAARRRSPSLEPLEDRRLLTLSVQFANPVAATGSGSVDVESNAVTNDAAGNVYITGSLVGTADFDPGPGTVNLTSAGGRDVFVAKYSKAGALLWAKDLRGGDASAVGQGSAIAVDASGNVVLSGTFTGTVNFDPNAGSTPFTAPGRNDIFVARFDPGGNLAWARAVAGTTGVIDQGYAVAVDASGSIAVAGSFSGAATFGGVTLNAGGSFDSFVAKLDASGTFLWARPTAGSGTSGAQAGGVTFDPSGNVISTGFFSRTVDFDPGPGTLSLTASGPNDVFVQKLDSSGGIVWARSIGADDINQGKGIAADAAGNVYVSGTFSTATDFDPGPGTAILTPGGWQDPFLLKLTATGQYAWARDLSVGAGGYGRGSGVALDGSGNVFTTGYFQGSLTPAAGTTFTGAGGLDVFVAQFSVSGNYLASAAYGGTGFDADFGVGVNASGQVAIAGRYTGPAAFGPFTLPSQTGKSVFVAQLASSLTPPPPPPLAPAAPGLQAASDTGLSSADGITKLNTLAFDTGTIGTGNLVELLRDGVVVGSRTGQGAVVDPGPVPDGAHVYTTRQTDSAGQTSAPSAATTVTVDTVTPTAPGAPVLVAADDSGVAGDAITSVKQPRMTGTVEANAAVQLLSGTTVIGTGTANAGVYSVTPATALADGVYVVRVRATDAAGNVSASGASFTLTVDATAPATPAAPALLTADDTGAVGDGTTSVRQPRIVGTAEANAAVQLFSGSTLIGAGAANGSGAYSVAPTSPLADGVYSLAVKATDAAGNASALGAIFRLTIGGNAPGTPSAPALLAADDSGVAGDGLTNVRQPRLTGLTTAGFGVQLLNAAGAVIGTATAAGSGAYSVAPASPLADGAYAVRLQVVDLAGNISPPSGSFSLTVDTTAPIPPSTPALQPADDSGVNGDAITNVRSPRFSGFVEAGTTVQLLDGSGAVVGSAAANAGGSFTVTPSLPLADGVYTFTGRAVDAAGNVGLIGGPTFLTVDGTAPASPSAFTLLAADDSGVGGDGVTNVQTPRLTGNAEPGATVQLRNASGAVVGSALANGSGFFTVSPSNSLADGSYSLRVRAVDVAGNIGPDSTLALTVDANAPATPGAPALLAADDTGAVGDGVTSVRSPRFVGTTEAGAVVQLLNAASAVVGSGTALANGSYSIAVAGPLADGVYAIRARSTDVAGNTSAAGAAFSVTIQTATITPATPSVPTLLAADDSGQKGDALTNVRAPRLVGTAALGSTVQLLNAAGAVVGSAAVGADGSYSAAPSAALTDGTYLIQARVLDGSGNLSLPSAASALTVDATAPATPAGLALLAADDSGTPGDGLTNVKAPRLTGTAEANATVQLLNAAGAVIGTATAAANGLYSVSPAVPLADGVFALRVQAVDAAGNTGVAGAAFTLTVDATAPAAPGALGLLAADDSGTVGDGLTNVRSPRLTGSAEARSTVQLLDGSGRVVGQAVAGTDGRVVVTPTSALADGVYVLTPRPVDAAGNVGPAGGSFRLTILTTSPAAPSAPTLLAADDSGLAGDAQTAVRQPRLTGTVAAGASVELVADGSSVVLASVTAALQNGAYTLQPVSNLGVGTYSFRVRVRDAAGNTTTGSPLAVKVVDAAASDYDGDGRTDLGVFRPSTSQWLSLNSSGTGANVVAFGAPNLFDIPVPGDYDGTGKSEYAVFRPGTAQWIILGPAGPRIVSFGATNLFDIPVPGDYDGVGYTELAVYRPSTSQWIIQGPTGTRVVTFGAPNLYDIPVPGDYDGTGKTQIAMYRPSMGLWFAQNGTDVKILGTFGATNLYDFPLNGPTAALKKLGAAGSIRIASASTTGPGQGIKAASIAQAPVTASVSVAPNAAARPQAKVVTVARSVFQKVVDVAVNGLTGRRSTTAGPVSPLGRRRAK